MMRATLAIAQNTFREVVRNRIFIVLILAACAITSLVLAMSSVSLNEEERIVIDIGLFLVSILGVGMSVLLGGTMVHKELERKTIYTILSKPIGRYQFIFGKYLGNLFVSALLVVILGSLLGLCLTLVGGQVTSIFLTALWFVFLEIAIVSALSIFFISFSSPILSGALAIGIFVSGRFVPVLREFKFGERQGDLAHVEQAIHALAAIVPDLSLYNVTAHLVHGQSLSFQYILHATVAGWAYILLCLLFGSIIFERRDLS